MSMVRYEILLPLRYNDGTPIEDEKLRITRRELVKKFGAVTMEPRGFIGVWVYQGQEYEDELIRLVIDTEDTLQVEEFFREYKECLKKRFNQLEIWITVYPIHII